MSMQWLVGAATVCVVGLAHFVTMVRSPRAVIYFDHFDFHQATLNRGPLSPMVWTPLFITALRVPEWLCDQAT